MLSSAIANILQTAVPHDTASLHTYEVIISAGLDSVHNSSVNRFIEMWNVTFGLQEITHCPSDVLFALQKLEHLVELRLPGSFPRAKPQVCFHCTTIKLRAFLRIHDRILLYRTLWILEISEATSNI